MAARGRVDAVVDRMKRAASIAFRCLDPVRPDPLIGCIDRMGDAPFGCGRRPPEADGEGLRPMREIFFRVRCGMPVR
jgi:hypothetical protein